MNLRQAAEILLGVLVILLIVLLIIFVVRELDDETAGYIAPQIIEWCRRC